MILSARRIFIGLLQLIGLFGFAFLLPIPFSFLYEDGGVSVGIVSIPYNVLVFLTCFAMTTIIGLIGRRLDIETDDDLNDREAFIVAGVGWILVTGLSALPFLLSGMIPNPLNAYFEAMSGLTSTGATILQVPLESLPPSVMLWRAQLNFIGGLGIIVLSAAFLTRFTHGGTTLMQAEATGTGLQKLTPRLRETAKALWKIYLIFSFVLFVLFLLTFYFHLGMGGMTSFYEAVLHTMTTISTGGFSNHSESIAYFDSLLVEVIMIVFMLIGGTSFTLHYQWQHGNGKALFRDPEWKFYMGMFALMTILTTAILFRSSGELGTSLRAAAFTVVSIGTSSGFATVDYDQWPEFAKGILVLMMLTGASAGSTSGGIKILRILLLFRIVRREIKHLIRPKEVLTVRLGRKTIRNDTILTIIAFLFTFLTVWVGGSMLISLSEPGFTLEESVAAGAAMIGNTGPALGAIGPTDNYGDLAPLTKFTMTMMMWFGRLEIFTPLLLFSPSTWRRI